MEKELKQINNEIKSYINQAKFISNNCRNKILKMLGNAFSVQLPIKNYANIDAEVTKDGDIIMRGDKYETTAKISTVEELQEKYNIFKEEAEKLLNKKEINYKTKTDKNNISNIIIVSILLIAYIIIIIQIVRAFILLDLFTASILLMILSSYLIPSIKDRFTQAKDYLKRKFNK